MNRLSRLTALLLALLMLLSNTAFAEAAESIAIGDFNTEGLERLFQSASQAADSADDSAENEKTPVLRGSIDMVGQTVQTTEDNVWIYKEANSKGETLLEGMAKGTKLFVLGYVAGDANAYSEFYHVRYVAEDGTVIEGYTECRQVELYVAPEVVEKTEEKTTEDGTTVTVSGSMPENVELELATVSEGEAKAILPSLVELDNAPYLAVDITLMQNGVEWQPGSDDVLEVAISAESIGAENDEIMVYHIHDDVTENLGVYTISGGKVTFEIDGFSTVLLVNCEGEYYCGIEVLANAPDPMMRYNWLLGKMSTDSNYFEHFMEHYKEVHIASNLICTCSETLLAPGVDGHADDCPWHASNMGYKYGDVYTNGVEFFANFPLDVDPEWKVADPNDVIIFREVLHDVENPYKILDVVLYEYDDWNNLVNWVASGDEKVRVTISANKDNNGMKLGDPGDRVILYHVHVNSNGDQEVEILGPSVINAEGLVSFDVTRFSYLLFVGLDVDGGTVEAGDPITPPLPDKPVLGNGVYTYADAGSYDLMNAAAEVSLPENGKATLNAQDGGKWQIAIGEDIWVNFAGETGASFDVTAAKLAAMGSSAQIRWVSEDGATVSETAVINITSAVSVAQNSGAAYATKASSADAGIALAAEGDTEKFNVVINYVFENGKIVTQPYTATLAKGSNFKATVNFTLVTGYLPYLGTDTESTTSLTLDITNIQADQIYTVTYKPTNVDYKVYHYRQNLNDDGYTLYATETKQGLTESVVPQVAKIYQVGNETVCVDENYRGFYSLLYENPKIAADGTTEIEVYYDRNYYLMNFDLSGGYGVDAIYDRFGTPIGDVGTPVRAGYEFEGWSLNGTDPVDLPTSMPAGNTTYIALWKEVELAKVSVVIWGENANDTEYSPLGNSEFYAQPGAEVTFQTGNLSCGYDEEHRHTEACYDCGNQEHTHGADCCELTAHTHGANCCQIEAHTHTDGCCSVPVHTHVRSCYAGAQNTTGNPDTGAPNSPQNGYVYGRYGSLTGKVIYINGTWYRYNGNTSTGSVATPSCGQTESTHDNHVCVYDKCGFDYEHTHDGENCVYCTEPEHTHGDGTCVYCDLPEHTHTTACLSCGEYEHTHDSSCYITDPGVDSGKWVLSHSDEVTVAADGSTVMNVYYKRVEYTFTFRVGSTTVHSFSAKWGSNIREKWTFTGSNGTTYSPENKDSWTGNVLYTQRIYMVEIMPEQNITFTRANGKNNSNTFYYYVESLENTAGTNKRQFDGKYYDYYFELVNDFGELYYDEDFFDLEGFTRYKSARANGNEYPLSNNGTNPIDNLYFYYTRNTYDLEFYNPTDLIKTNEGVPYQAPLAPYDWTPDDSFAPEQYAPGSVKFAGWYMNPECSEGHEYDLKEHTMPVGTENGEVALRLYAKWEPIPLTVEFYLTRDELVADQSSITQTHPTVQVPYGSLLTPVPEKPKNGDYDFVGWFYLDENGEEQAFDFANMQVRRNLKVYAKWSSNVLKKYVVLFKYKNDAGEEIEIADRITGSTRAGETKTFDAKGGDELNPGYQEGYFPLVESHSMLLEINSATKPGVDENGIEWTEITNADGEKEIVQSFTFYYEPVEEVPYTVYYVTDTLKEGTTALGTVMIDDAGIIVNENGKTYYLIAPTFTDDDNRKAVVTETFKPISGYMPDAYQKRLVVIPHAANNLIFYYSIDTEHAYYRITHWQQNLEGGGYTENEALATEAIGDIGENPTKLNSDDFYTTINGFTYVPSKTVEKVGDKETVVGNTEVVLTEEGLELRIYYDRNLYAYQVQYLEYGTEKLLADTKQGDPQMYGKVVSESAIDIEHYTALDPTSQTLNIDVVDPSNPPEPNVITFYYVEMDATIDYKIVDPAGNVLENTNEECGWLTLGTETIKVLNGTVTGSTATAYGPTYKFVGWYTDAAYTQPVPDAWVDKDGKIVPQMTGIDDDDVAYWENKTYYAKFEYNIADLTITKTVEPENANVAEDYTNHEFTFEVFIAQDGEYTYTVGDETKTLNVANGKGTLKLKHGESAVIHGVLISSQYRVVEVENDDDYYTLKSKTGDSDTIAAADNTAEFVNTYHKLKEQTLTIKKKVVDASGTYEATKFTFTVDLADRENASEWLKEQFGAARVVEIEVAADKLGVEIPSAELTLPVGSYVVTETPNAAFETTYRVGQDVTNDNAQVTVPAGNGVSVSVTNTRIVQDISVTKDWQDNDNALGLRPTQDDMPYVNVTLNGANTLTLNDANNWTSSWTNLPVYDLSGNPINYTVAEMDVAHYETTYKLNGGTASATAPEFELSAGDAAVLITNTISVGNLAITKMVVDEDTTDDVTPNPDKAFTFTVTLPVGTFTYTVKNADNTDATPQNNTITNNGTITLKDGQTATIKNLPKDGEYTVTEAEEIGYTTTMEGNAGTIAAGQTMTAAFTNTFEVADLTITKTIVDANGNEVSDDNTADDVFTFDVTIGGETQTVTITGKNTATIENIPINTPYTVEEKYLPNGYTIDDSAKTVTGTIPEAGATATFANTYTTGSLTISKTVVGTEAPRGTDVFTFTVSLPNGTYSYTKTGVNGTQTVTVDSGVDGVNGTETFTLMDGESVTITGIPTGASYTVKETADPDYTTTVNDTAEAETGMTGIVVEEGRTLAYVNTYKYDSLTITKKGLDVYAYDGVIDQESAIFTVHVVDGTFDKTYTIALANEGSATITGLPIGASYTITEQNGWTWRYSNVDLVEGEIEDGDNSVTINNSATNPYWLGGDNYKVNTFGTPGTN